MPVRLSGFKTKTNTLNFSEDIVFVLLSDTHPNEIQHPIEFFKLNHHKIIRTPSEIAASAHDDTWSQNENREAMIDPTGSQPMKNLPGGQN